MHVWNDVTPPWRRAFGLRSADRMKSLRYLRTRMATFFSVSLEMRTMFLGYLSRHSLR